MAARNRVVTPSFVYRRSFNHCPYMTSQIECRGISGFGVGANWNVARCTHYTVYSKMHAKFYKVDFALASAQASGHCNGCRAGKSSLMRRVSFPIHRRNVGKRNTTSSPDEAPRLLHQKLRGVTPGSRRRARCLAFRYPLLTTSPRSPLAAAILPHLSLSPELLYRDVLLLSSLRVQLLEKYSRRHEL